MPEVKCKECGKVYNIKNWEENVPCKGCKVARKRAYFEHMWTNGGSFMSKLCSTLTVADTTNLKRLHKSFPDLVDGYIAYISNKTWEEWLSV